MVYYCCFSLGGNLDFLDFLQKKFYNINYRTRVRVLKILFTFHLDNLVILMFCHKTSHYGGWNLGKKNNLFYFLFFSYYLCWLLILFLLFAIYKFYFLIFFLFYILYFHSLILSLIYFLFKNVERFTILHVILAQGPC